LLKRYLRGPIAHIFVVVEFRKCCDDHDLGGKVRQEPRQARNQLGKLETGEGASNLDLPAELLEGHATLASQAFQEARISTVGAVQHQDSLPLEQQARKEIVAEPRRVVIAVEECQAARRKSPRTVRRGFYFSLRQV